MTLNSKKKNRKKKYTTSIIAKKAMSFRFHPDFIKAWKEKAKLENRNSLTNFIENACNEHIVKTATNG